MPLPLRLPEGDAEAVPRKPSATAPAEKVAECETEAETLGLGEFDIEARGHCEGVCVKEGEVLLL